MENSVSVNLNMKNPKLNVGILTPPNAFHKPVLYSPEQATRDITLINKDIYTSMKNSESLEKRKTPKSVFAFLGIGALAICFPFIKKIFKK